MKKRRYPIGAEVIDRNRVHFRVWAPKAKKLAVVVAGKTTALRAEKGGYFSGAAEARAGARYRFSFNDVEYPDPASRAQPEGPHGESCVVDPFRFRWSDSRWRGVALASQIFYEFHVGTFTPEGTWRSAIRKLPALRRTGVTCLEMMPIADFPGKFGWGYDGVNLFAPTHLYGTPDDLRAFIDAAHGHGLGVILDVVYNHFGPEGNYLGAFSGDYIHPGRKNEWGDTINFDGNNSAPVREFFITNGRYWIEEFHFDGFRFDATQGIHDGSREYIVGAIGRAARKAAGKKRIILVAENEPQETKLVRPRAQGGDDLDGLWNDDWHHSAAVALTRNREAYYTDYTGTPQEFISAAKYGYLFQGQPYAWQKAPRGSSAAGLSPEAFVTFLENHDQVSNSAFAERKRLTTTPGKYRAMTALLLLGPWTPLLFQGEEFGATTPFPYFADVGDDQLKDAVKNGRFDFLAQFPSAATPEARARLAVPHEVETFQSAKLDWSRKHPELVALHRDLIKLRRTDSRLRCQTPGGVDGAVLNPSCFLLRYLGEPENQRLLIVNLGERFIASPCPEPLLAPPDGFAWKMVWSSEETKYAGAGRPTLNPDERWDLPAEAAILYAPGRRTAPRKKPESR